MIKRRETKTVTIGNVKIGSKHPVRIQSMTKTDTSDLSATICQIHALQKAGCELVRVAVKDMKDAAAISGIKKEIQIPLIADIHFDHRLALEAIAQGADKIRINPGNMKKSEDIDMIIDSAFEKRIPVRLGINSGSLMEMASGEAVPSDKMMDALSEYLEQFRLKNFEDIVISLKSSDVLTTVAAYRKVSAKYDFPVHLGVTAAGSPEQGIIKSSVGIGALLIDGIGDTIRVSLTGAPVREVEAARQILISLGLRHFGPQIIACPTCGRCQVDLIRMVKELEAELKRVMSREPRDTEKPTIIAVMGCEVNGPGEAKIADIGIAFGNSKGAIFQNGEIIKTVNVSDAVRELINILKKGSKK